MAGMIFKDGIDKSFERGIIGRRYFLRESAVCRKELPEAVESSEPASFFVIEQDAGNGIG
jgi:hypothetical protein